MDRIQQAYAGVDEEEEQEEEEEEEEQDARDEAAVSATGRKRAAEPAPMQQQQQQQQRDRRRRRLPDAGQLLDGTTTIAPSARAAAVAATGAAPLPPPPPAPQQQLVGPPAHDGNFPFLVYVPVPATGALAEALAALVAAAAPSVPGLEPLVVAAGGGGAMPKQQQQQQQQQEQQQGEDEAPPPPNAAVPDDDVPLHVSLTRSGTVRLRQAAPLVAALGRRLSKKGGGGGGGNSSSPPLLPPPSSSAGRPPPAIAVLGRPRAFLNDERTRTFLVLTALDPSADVGAATGPCAPALLRAIARCDAALRGLGLPAYYSDAQPHVSLASAPAASHAAMEAAAAGPVARALEARGRGALALPYPRAALCQIGRRRHVVWGEEG
jgi:hypothetical protein